MASIKFSQEEGQARKMYVKNVKNIYFQDLVFLRTSWSLRSCETSSIAPQVLIQVLKLPSRTSVAHTQISGMWRAPLPLLPLAEVKCILGHLVFQVQTSHVWCLLDKMGGEGPLLRNLDYALETGSILVWRMTTFDRNARTQASRSTHTRARSGIGPTFFE